MRAPQQAGTAPWIGTKAASICTHEKKLVESEGKGEGGKEEEEEVREKRREGSGAFFYGLRGAREVASWGPFLRPVFLFSQSDDGTPQQT